MGTLGMVILTVIWAFPGVPQRGRQDVATRPPVAVGTTLTSGPGME